MAQVERQEAQARDRKERLEAEERNRKRDRLEELSRRREELAYQIRRDSVRRTGLMATSEELGKQNLKEFFLLLAAAPILLVLAFTLWLYVYDFWATTSLCGFIWVAFWIQLKFRRYIDHKRSIPRWDRSTLERYPRVKKNSTASRMHFNRNFRKSGKCGYPTRLIWIVDRNHNGRRDRPGGVRLFCRKNSRDGEDQERHISDITDAIKAQARAQKRKPRAKHLVMGLASATSEGIRMASELELNKRSIKNSRPTLQT